jgi:menaquinol-cytochrome c reductase iron-sulfur subunit
MSDQSDQEQENGEQASAPKAAEQKSPPPSTADTIGENDNDSTSEEAEPCNQSRRNFVAKAGSVCAGCALVGIPIAAGIPVILDPLRKGGTGEADFLKVTSLDALPADGTPLLVTVRADKQDAWSRFPNRAIGAIYVRRLSESGNELQAFNVVCPHLGCAVEFRPDQHDYFCKCHDSAFEFAQGTQEKGSPSARGLDTLPTELRNDGEVWVQFQNFLTGKKEKVSV